MSLPQETDRVVNNVVRPFRGESEVDRRRATEILDYIVRKRREASNKKDRLQDAMEDAQRRAFIDILEAERRADLKKNLKRTGTIHLSGSRDTRESLKRDEDGQFVPDDKYGRVLKKDIDKLTGGMQVVKETSLDLSKF